MAFTQLTEAFHEAVALLLQQKGSFEIKMYIEYSASPSSPAQATVANTGDHNAYYTGLTGADFLRVDVAQFSRVVASGHYQGLNTLDYTNNKITFTGFTSDGGSSGEKGTGISSKKVYGAAIVVSDTSVNTVANDIIIARSYFDSADYITVATAKGASVRMALNLVNDGACTAFGAGSITFTDVPVTAGTVTLIDNAATPVTKVFEFISTTVIANGSTVNTVTGSGSTTNICVGTKAIAAPATGTVTITDLTELNDGDKVTLIATDATSHDFTAGSVAGGGVWIAETDNNTSATNLAAAIAGNTKFIAQTFGSNAITITQVVVEGYDHGDGNTAITLTDSFAAGMSKVDFTGGVTNLETIEDRFEGAVNGATSFAITASDDLATSGKCTLIQDYCNSTGNTTITDSATNVTTVSFTGGA